MQSVLDFGTPALPRVPVLTPPTARPAVAWPETGRMPGTDTSQAVEQSMGQTMMSPGMGRGMGSASVLPGLRVGPYLPPRTATLPDPDVWLIALTLPSGGLRPLEGAGRSGAIRVSRPYGHLRALRPVTPPELFAAGESGGLGTLPVRSTTRSRRSRSLGSGLGSGVLAAPASGSVEAREISADNLPAERPKPQIISSVEVETDAGVFRVERPHGVLGHSDLAWALANLEAGEPDSLVPLPRRQLTLLLTLLPTPEDPEHPEQDPRWGWAHKLKAPWERGPLHPRGRLGRLIAVDPDLSNQGMHRACFEMLGTEEIVWALGVPCYRTGSVYELVPLRRGLGASRWLTWPLAKASKGRARTGAVERPQWEIARVVYRVGSPRWPLAGVVEPLGPLGVAG
jgi:hypothetical protein